jgi:hypothetical protein
MSKNGEGKPRHDITVLKKSIMTVNLRWRRKFYLVSKPQALIHYQLTEDSFFLRLNTDIIQAERTPGYLTVKQNSIGPLCVLRIKQN